MIATVTLLILIVILVTGLARIKSKNRPPGPISWPIIGNQSMLKRLTKKYGAFHLALIELSKQYGSNVVRLHLGSSKVLVVSGNELLQSLLKNEAFDGRPWNEFIRMRNLGKKQGITMNDGKDWKELRGWMINTLKYFGFGKQTMTDMITDELLVILKKLEKGGVRNLNPVIAPAVINVLWRLVTGKRFCEGAKLQYFIDLMDRRTRVFDIAGGLLSTFPWIRYIAPEASGYNILVTLNDELKGFLMENIMEHKEKYMVGSEGDMIDKFLQVMIDNKDPNTVYTVDQLVMILIDLFLAGFTTTTIALDFLFLNMVVHQHVQQKLHKEIDAVISSDRLPNLADRAKMPYTEAVMHESMRMWPVFPVIGPRRVLFDTQLGDYVLPKESTVLMNIYSVHRDPKLYPEPDEFIPERYMKNGAFEADANSISFGKGHRRCPGETLAKASAFLMFIGVMQKFDLLPVPGKGPSSVDIVPGLAIMPQPYEVLLVPR